MARGRRSRTKPAAKRPVVPPGRKLPQTSGGPSLEATSRAVTAQRKAAKMPAGPTPRPTPDRGIIGTIQDMAGKVFPAGKSGPESSTSRATRTYGRLDEIIRRR